MKQDRYQKNTNMKLKNFLQNFFGYLLLLLSLPMFAEGGKGIIGGLIMIAAGLVVIPQSRAILEKKFNTRFTRPFKYFAAITGYFAISIFSPPVPGNGTASHSAQQEDTNRPTVQTIKTGIIIAQDSFSNVASVQSLERTTEPVKTEISKPKPPVNSTGNNVSLKSATANYSKTQDSPAGNSHPAKRKSRSGISRNGYGKSYTSGRSGYIRGPRGGCYYINSNGNKTYVDHSYCN